MANYDESEGVWRTVGGRRIFIKKGQDLADAMIQSGKFKNLRSDYRKAKEEDKTKSEYELYKRAKENPDSIDPMTENSTDWEALESKYKDRYEKENKPMNEEEFTKKIREIQSTPLYKEKMDEAVEELNKKYGYTSTNEKKALGRGLDSLGNESADGEGLKKMFGKENKDGFTQKTDMYGGTREYSKEQLDKMEQHGTKPMEHSYTGGGWEGTKYDSKLSTKDIAKNINDYAKKEFPDVKLSRKTDYNGIDIHVMSSDKDLYASASDIDKMSDKQVSDTIRDSIGGYTRMDDWLNANNRKSANGTFTAKDERDYLKEQLNTYKSRKGDNVSGNEWYLSDYGKKVISGLNKEMNSYNYDDSDGMVDYFNTNFYGYVHIGKWDKPYEVSESKSSGNQISNNLQQKAYQKYMKEHPGSKMTFEDYKKQK